MPRFRCDCCGVRADGKEYRLKDVLKCSFDETKQALLHLGLQLANEHVHDESSTVCEKCRGVIKLKRLELTRSKALGVNGARRVLGDRQARPRAAAAAVSAGTGAADDVHMDDCAGPALAVQLRPDSYRRSTRSSTPREKENQQPRQQDHTSAATLQAQPQHQQPFSTRVSISTGKQRFGGQKPTAHEYMRSANKNAAVYEVAADPLTMHHTPSNKESTYVHHQNAAHRIKASVLRDSSSSTAVMQLQRQHLPAAAAAAVGVTPGSFNDGAADDVNSWRNVRRDRQLNVKAENIASRAAVGIRRLFQTGKA